MNLSQLLPFLLCLLLALAFSGCALIATRPLQEMNNTAAAMRAAKEVQADTLAPELFRQASEWYLRAKNEYRFKNFKLASEYASKARRFAETAEFESVRNGGVRQETGPVDPQKITPPADPLAQPQH